MAGPTKAQLEAQLEESRAETAAQIVKAEAAAQAAAQLAPAAVRDIAYKAWQVYAKGIAGGVAFLSGLATLLLAQPAVVGWSGAHWIAIGSGALTAVSAALVPLIPNKPGAGLAVVDTDTGKQVA